MSTVRGQGHSIGEIGERFVAELCTGALTRDFVFRNPKYMRGAKSPKEKELCDTLIWMDDTVVVVQVKTADPSAQEKWTIDEVTSWANSKVNEAIDSVRGAVSALQKSMIVELENPWQGKVPFDHRTIRHVYGLVVVDHPKLERWGAGAKVEVSGHRFSVMTASHRELADIFTELSTIGDFLDYLQARDEFFAKHFLPGTTELDLLALYKRDPLKFREQVRDLDFILFESNLWEAFSAAPQRALRAEADRNSFIVDVFIDTLHEGIGAEHTHIEDLEALAGVKGDSLLAYRRVLGDLAQLRRIERREIGEKIVTKSHGCVSQRRARWFAFSRADKVHVFVFLITESSRAERTKQLTSLGMAAKFLLGSKVVTGVATEPVCSEGFSLDAFRADSDPDEDKKTLSADALTIAKKLFPTLRSRSTQEFPTDQRS